VADLNQSRRAALEAFAERLDPDERARFAEALAPLLALPQVAACRPKDVE
jgi:uncharacterized membrane protein